MLQTSNLPFGIEPQSVLKGHKSRINELKWAPNGELLAAASSDKSLSLWDPFTGKNFWMNKIHFDIVRRVCWAPNSKYIATASDDGTIHIVSVKNGNILKTFEIEKNCLPVISWSAKGIITVATNFNDRILQINPKQTSYTYFDSQHHDRIYSMSWSPSGNRLALCSADKSISLWSLTKGKITNKIILAGHIDSIRDVTWSNNDRTLASAADDNTIRVWKNNKQVSILEGHTDDVVSLRFTPDSKLLVSQSRDDTIRIWRLEKGETISIVRNQPCSRLQKFDIHPTEPFVAWPVARKRPIIRVAYLDKELLNEKRSIRKTVRHTSAKVVLVGDSNVGKSCLALRITENRFPNPDEMGTTHGMRFWTLNPAILDSSYVPPVGEQRDIVLWDMGGQDEYRLIHQLFLHDTTLALILFDPTRGHSAISDAISWAKRLEKQFHGRQVSKILIGAKVDEPSQLVNLQHIKNLIDDNIVDHYIETSALSCNGIKELKKYIYCSLDWEGLAKTSRPELFQMIRDEIQLRRDKGDVVTTSNDIKISIEGKHKKKFGINTIKTVADHLALQGLIGRSFLATGEEAFVLQVGEIERYAGSLIIAARNNPRGIPALDERRMLSPTMVFPGINKRLDRINEKVILECVIELLIEHGICFRHQRLLIFPSLFPSNKHDEERIIHSISLYYDFSGAIDNTYASLIASLVISDAFGRVRLWGNRAEFETQEDDLCGLRKVDRGSGFAHLDLFFGDDADEDTKNSFVNFVENHLLEYGIEIVENLEITCKCNFHFREETVRKRLAMGEYTIICPECEHRTQLSEGAKKAREKNNTLESNTWALRTEIREKRKQIIDEVREQFSEISENIGKINSLRILHLSDLHISSKTDIRVILRPLITDLKNNLEVNRLDWLVVSGDLTETATPDEFEKASLMISELIDNFGLNAERCIVTPGNHDLSWEEPIYDWKRKRQVNIDEIKSDSYVPEGSGYLIRNDEKYRDRFRNFSRYFFHPLMQKEYPLNYQDQALSYFFPIEGVQFLALNSSWMIDESFPARSDINKSSLSFGLDKADNEIFNSIESGILSKNTDIIRIGVWHHPASGKSRIEDDTFLEQLESASFKICLHGHVHEERADVVGYFHNKVINLLGAGALAARASQRPESTPRLYNLIEINKKKDELIVNTRCQKRMAGVWSTWAVWPGMKKNEMLGSYKIPLKQIVSHY